jgi:hypothetical protein
MNEYIPIIKFYIIAYPIGRWKNYQECYDYYYDQHKIFYDEHKELLSENIIEINSKRDADKEWNNNIIGEIKMVQIDTTHIDDHIKEIESIPYFYKWINAWEIPCKMKVEVKKEEKEEYNKDDKDNESLHPHHSNHLHPHSSLNTATHLLQTQTIYSPATFISGFFR